MVYLLLIVQSEQSLDRDTLCKLLHFNMQVNLGQRLPAFEHTQSERHHIFVIKADLPVGESWLDQMTMQFMMLPIHIQEIIELDTSPCCVFWHLQDRPFPGLEESRLRKQMEVKRRSKSKDVCGVA